MLVQGELYGQRKDVGGYQTKSLRAGSYFSLCNIILNFNSSKNELNR